MQPQLNLLSFKILSFRQCLKGKNIHTTEEVVSNVKNQTSYDSQWMWSNTLWLKLKTFMPEALKKHTHMHTQI